MEVNRQPFPLLAEGSNESPDVAITSLEVANETLFPHAPSVSALSDLRYRDIPKLKTNVYGLESFAEFCKAAQRIESGLPPVEPRCSSNAENFSLHGTEFKFYDSENPSDSEISESDSEAESLPQITPRQNLSARKDLVATPEVSRRLSTRKNGTPSGLVSHLSALRSSLVPSPLPPSLSPIGDKDGDQESEMNTSETKGDLTFEKEGRGSVTPDINSELEQEEVANSIAKGHESSQISHLVFDYASTASPGSRRTSRFSSFSRASHRPSVDAGVQASAEEVESPCVDEKKTVLKRAKLRASMRRSSVFGEPASQSKKRFGGFTGVIQEKSGSMICTINGKQFELIIEDDAGNVNKDMAIQCSGIELDAEVDALFASNDVVLETGRDVVPGRVDQATQTEEEEMLKSVEAPEEQNQQQPEITIQHESTGVQKTVEKTANVNDSSLESTKENPQSVPASESLLQRTAPCTTSIAMGIIPETPRTVAPNLQTQHELTPRAPPRLRYPRTPLTAPPAVRSEKHRVRPLIRPISPIFARRIMQSGSDKGRSSTPEERPGAKEALAGTIRNSSNVQRRVSIALRATILGEDERKPEASESVADMIVITPPHSRSTRNIAAPLSQPQTLGTSMFMSTPQASINGIQNQDCGFGASSIGTAYEPNPNRLMIRQSALSFKPGLPVARRESFDPETVEGTPGESANTFNASMQFVRQPSISIQPRTPLQPMVPPTGALTETPGRSEGLHKSVIHVPQLLASSSTPLAERTRARAMAEIIPGQSIASSQRASMEMEQVHSLVIPGTSFGHSASARQPGVPSLNSKQAGMQIPNLALPRSRISNVHGTGSDVGITNHLSLSIEPGTSAAEKSRSPLKMGIVQQQSISIQPNIPNHENGERFEKLGMQLPRNNIELDIHGTQGDGQNTLSVRPIARVSFAPEHTVLSSAAAQCQKQTLSMGLLQKVVDVEPTASAYQLAAMDTFTPRTYAKVLRKSLAPLTNSTDNRATGLSERKKNETSLKPECNVVTNLDIEPIGLHDSGIRNDIEVGNDVDIQEDVGVPSINVTPVKLKRSGFPESSPSNHTSSKKGSASKRTKEKPSNRTMRDKPSSNSQNASAKNKARSESNTSRRARSRGTKRNHEEAVSRIEVMGVSAGDDHLSKDITALNGALLTPAPLSRRGSTVTEPDVESVKASSARKDPIGSDVEIFDHIDENSTKVPPEQLPQSEIPLPMADDDDDDLNYLVYEDYADGGDDDTALLDMENSIQRKKRKTEPAEPQIAKSKVVQRKKASLHRSRRSTRSSRSTRSTKSNRSSRRKQATSQEAVAEQDSKEYILNAIDDIQSVEEEADGTPAHTPPRATNSETTTATRRTDRQKATKRSREMKYLNVNEVSTFANEDESGVRRSKRQRFPRLKYWKNETVVYNRRSSQVLPTIASVVVSTDDGHTDDDSWIR